MITKSENVFEIVSWLFERMTNSQRVELETFLNSDTPFELVVRYQDEEVKERLRKEVSKRWNNLDTKFTTKEENMDTAIEEGIGKMPAPVYKTEKEADRACTTERFGAYRKPTEVTIPKYQQIQEKALEFALLIEDLCPRSQQKSSALTLLEQCKMSANAAIAIHS